MIIPVYNSEKFLRKCLDNIISQSYKNLEIIVVNDCSPGNAGEIVREYIKTDSRIKLITHRENKGSFRARVSGIKAAKGAYIAFVDSDDRISRDYYSVLITKAVETGSDMVIADFMNEYENGKTFFFNFDPIRLQDLNLRGERVFDMFIRQQGKFYGWHVIWNKIYSRKLCKKSLPFFKKIKSNLMMTDDIAHSCVFWILAQKVANVHDVYYFYLQHAEQSVAGSDFKKGGDLKKLEKNASDVVLAFDFFKNIMIKFDKWEKYERDYTKFKELYIKYWSANAKKFEGEDLKKAEELIKNLFGISELYELTKDDNSAYMSVTEVNFTEK